MRNMKHTNKIYWSVIALTTILLFAYPLAVLPFAFLFIVFRLEMFRVNVSARLREQHDKINESISISTNHAQAITLLSKELQRFKSEINKKYDMTTKRLTYVERHVDVKNQNRYEKNNSNKSTNQT